VGGCCAANTSAEAEGTVVVQDALRIRGSGKELSCHFDLSSCPVQGRGVRTSDELAATLAEAGFVRPVVTPTPGLFSILAAARP